MSIGLRIVLLIVALLSGAFIVYRIRRSKVRLQDTLFWVFTTVILALMGIFPQISFTAARLLGIQAPVNFVYLSMIALLFEKLLTLSIQHSKLKEDYVELAAELALRCKNLEEQVESLKKSEQ